MADESDWTGADGIGYGAVLDELWTREIEQTAHPIDGSPVFSVPAAAGPNAVETLVLLHGVGNDGSIFGPMMPALAALGRVVAPTVSAELLTGVGDERSTMSANLIDWLSEVAPPPWRLVGHSMGGVLSGLILRTRPDLVAGVVLLNAPVPGVVNRISFRDRLDRPGRALLIMKALAAVTAYGRPRLPRFLRGAELAALRVGLRGFVHDPSAIDDRVLSHAVLDSRTADANRFIRLAEGLPAWESEPFTAVPVAIVLGDTDPLIPLSDVHAIVDAYPNATIDVFANCGHFAHLEWSRSTVDTIANFFTDLATA